VALRRLFALFVIVGVACGCNRSAAPEATRKELDALSVTRWTDKTELFAEYPPLAAGSTSRFAIHLTRLDTFKPLTDGNVQVRLEGGASPPEAFDVRGPSRPGIFGVDVKPTHAGKRQLIIVLRASGLVDEHRVGEVDVYADTEAARTAAAAGGEDVPGIRFLKEQQWSLDFGTALVKEQAVRESLRVPAHIEARPPHARPRDSARSERLSGARARPATPTSLRASRAATTPTCAGGSADGAGPCDARSRAGRTLDHRRCCTRQAVRGGPFG
jgi:cobalt-zinc-cadmium efflux system membrane fusion protein